MPNHSKMKPIVAIALFLGFSSAVSVAAQLPPYREKVKVSSWAAALDSAGATRAFRGSPCGQAQPDSVALLQSPYELPYNSFVAARYAVQLGTDTTWVASGTDGDELRARLAEVRCDAPFVYFALERSGRFITVRYPYISATTEIPQLRIIAPTGLARAFWDGKTVIDHIGRRDSVIAAAQATAAARFREDSLRQVAAERADREAARAVEARRVAKIETQSWQESFKRAAIEKRVVIGMTPEMVRASWGEPQMVNETITTTGKSEQWVYSIYRYVYLRNGRVTAIQVTR